MCNLTFSIAIFNKLTCRTRLQTITPFLTACGTCCDCVDNYAMVHVISISLYSLFVLVVLLWIYFQSTTNTSTSTKILYLNVNCLLINVLNNTLTGMQQSNNGREKRTEESKQKALISSFNKEDLIDASIFYLSTQVDFPPFNPTSMINR